MENSEQLEELTEEQLEELEKYNQNVIKFKDSITDAIFNNWDAEILGIHDVFVTLTDILNEFFFEALEKSNEIAFENGKQEVFSNKVKQEIDDLTK